MSIASRDGDYYAAVAPPERDRVPTLHARTFRSSWRWIASTVADEAAVSLAELEARCVDAFGADRWFRRHGLREGFLRGLSRAVDAGLVVQIGDVLVRPSLARRFGLMAPAP